METPNANDRRDRFEVYNTVILAVATLAVTWCSYQSHLWGGIQTFRLAESNRYGRLAQQELIRAGQSAAMDEAVVVSFINAVVDGNQKRIDFILKGTKDLSHIMSEWLALYQAGDTLAPLHPMVMPSYLELNQKRIRESEKIAEKAGEVFESADKANTISDNYDLFAVMFSMVMFLGAIATKARRAQIHFTLVVFSAIICIAVLTILFTSMPVAHKGLTLQA